MMIYTHVFLLPSPVLQVTGGAGEQEWNTMLKDAFINSVKAPFRTAVFFPSLTRRWESLDEKKHVSLQV